MANKKNIIYEDFKTNGVWAIWDNPRVKYNEWLNDGFLNIIKKRSEKRKDVYSLSKETTKEEKKIIAENIGIYRNKLHNLLMKELQLDDINFCTFCIFAGKYNSLITNPLEATELYDNTKKYMKVDMGGIE